MALLPPAVGASRSEIGDRTVSGTPPGTAIAPPPPHLSQSKGEPSSDRRLPEPSLASQTELAMGRGGLAEAGRTVGGPWREMPSAVGSTRGAQSSHRAPRNRWSETCQLGWLAMCVSGPQRRRRNQNRRWGGIWGGGGRHTQLLLTRGAQSWGSWAPLARRRIGTGFAMGRRRDEMGIWQAAPAAFSKPSAGGEGKNKTLLQKNKTTNTHLRQSKLQVAAMEN